MITAAGTIRAERVGLAAASHAAALAAKAGFELPTHVYTLQAMVSEPVKPALDCVVLILGTGTYVSQSGKGELVFGGGIERVTSFAQRGNPPVHEFVVAGLIEAFPGFGQLKLMRQWAGAVDVVPDSSPLIGPAPVPGLFLNCGWGAGGFKAIPAGGWLLAHLLAKGEHHPISRPFDLDRFARGALIDEAIGSGIAPLAEAPRPSGRGARQRQCAYWAIGAYLPSCHWLMSKCGSLTSPLASKAIGPSKVSTGWPLFSARATLTGSSEPARLIPSTIAWMTPYENSVKPSGL